MSAKFKWFKITNCVNTLVWQPNNMCVVEVNAKKITLAQQNNTIVAFAYTCPHAGGIMANGYLDAIGNVVCPLHRYKFNTVTGRNTTGEGYFLKTYQLQNRAKGLYIGFNEKGFFGFL